MSILMVMVHVELTQFHLAKLSIHQLSLCDSTCEHIVNQILFLNGGKLSRCRNFWSLIFPSFFFPNSQEDSWIILLRFFFQIFLLSNNFFLSFVIVHREFSNFGDLVKSYHSIRKFDSFEIKELIDLKSFRGSPRYSQKIFQFKSVRVRLTKYPYFKSIIAASKLIALN